MLRRGPLLALALLAVPLALRAQGPEAAWRTVESEHFRVHYPAPSEEWALAAAARLEAIRERVSSEVGYLPAEVIDVLVMDPVAQANGMALPILGAPRMVLWTTPPGPASGIGHYRDWREVLLIHEQAHLAHLLRPSRNPWQRRLSRVLLVGPLTRRSPRWLFEGYATVIEGRLTGWGRPHDDLRSAILRRRAQAGQLPSYAALASDSESWRGQSMAYLAGSAFIEWLEERAGPDSLGKLWARMSARTSRSFDDAFEGVFGEPPARLYGRFTAELTWRAMEAERRLGASARQGDLWQDLSWTTGEPAISPDGSRLAVVLRARRRSPRLVVWSLAPDAEAEAEQRRRERIEGLLARDPEDVPAVASKPAEREPLHELPTTGGAPPETPRWLPDGRSLLYVRYLPDRRGVLHADLFRWTLPGPSGGGGRVERLTRGGDLSEPDPAPDGAWAVAVRGRHGTSQLVRIDLASGDVEPLTPATINAVWAQPRVSPDGRRLAAVVNRGAGWGLVVLELGTGKETPIPTPPGTAVAFPAWSPDGKTLYATLGMEGFLDLWALPAATSGEPRRLTRTHGAALAAEPAPAAGLDGAALYFLSLEADGLDLRRLPLNEVPEEEPLAGSETAADPALAPAVRPPPGAAPAAVVTAEVAAPRPYRLGRLELFPLLAFEVSPGARAGVAGVRAGDVVGRLDLVAQAAAATSGELEGAALAAAFRGTPVELRLHLFHLDERPSEAPGLAPGLGSLLDLERSGGELAALWDGRYPAGRLSLEAAVYADRVARVGRGEPARDRRIASLAAGWDGLASRGEWSLVHRLAGRWQEGESDGDRWRRWRGEASLGLVRRSRGLTATLRRAAAEAAERPADQLRLGGLTSTLLPASEAAGRIELAALPAGIRIGDDYQAQRLTLDPGGSLPALFYERHRLRPAGGEGDWLALAGAEWRLVGEPLPLVRLPAFDLWAGAAVVLDPPFEDEVRAWAALRWRP